MAAQTKTTPKPKPKPSALPDISPLIAAISERNAIAHEIARPERNAIAHGAKKPKSKRGRKKERTQISVRLDTTVMALAHKHLTAGMRITELLERGLLLALRELGDVDPIHHHLRLVLHDQGVKSSRFMMDANVLLNFPEVRVLSLAENSLREHMLDTISNMPRWMDYGKVLSFVGTPHDREDDEVKRA